MEYVCPKCGRIENFKSLLTIERKIKNKEMCRRCKEKMKNELTNYSRKCPNCGKIIYYKYKSDLNKATKINSLCKHCSGTITGFKKGHKLNDVYTKCKNSLSRLIVDQSLQTFYWIGFLLADGSFYGNRFEFGLRDSDKNVLEEFARYIRYIGSIKHRKNTNSNRIYFSNSKSIPEFMLKYGLSYNKTYNPPEFSYYSSYSRELLLALLVGLIDGDGSISLNGSEHSNAITITSHKSWKIFILIF